MNSLLKTFRGSLKDLVSVLEKVKSIRQRDGWGFDFFDDLDDPELVESIRILYSGQKGVEKAFISFSTLSSKLRKIKQYFNSSRRKEGERDFANEDIAKAVEDFTKSLPAALTAWKISPLPIERIDELIKYAKTYEYTLKVGPKLGRPPKPFNVLLFHVVKWGTENRYGSQGSLIKKGAKIRVYKNWQLICIALLWFHIQYGIPEIETFIEKNGQEEVNAAFEKLKSIAKKRVQNFRRSGKGTGKFAGRFGDHSDYIGILIPYLTRKGMGRTVL